jgi:heme oxygenase
LTHAALTALRDGTAQVHRRLEVDLPLMRPDLSTDGYHAILGRFWGIIAPLEDEFERAGVPLDDWPHRRKAPLLVADLADLADVRGLPRCDDVPALLGHDAVLGCLYVVEGSTLGGRQVAAHVQGLLGAAVGTRYFRSYGDAVGTRWRTFREAVARRADAGGDVDAMVGSALATFELLHGWLTP